MPDDNKIIVFNKGTPNGLNGDRPIGGHCLPSSIAGASLLWKKAQKKDKKKNTSDTINKIIPHRRPNSTMAEWSPWKAPSREISRHHWIITNPIIKMPPNINVKEFLWNHFTNPVVKKNAPVALIKGHGDSSTRW